MMQGRHLGASETPAVTGAFRAARIAETSPAQNALHAFHDRNDSSVALRCRHRTGWAVRSLTGLFHDEAIDTGPTSSLSPHFLCPQLDDLLPVPRSYHQTLATLIPHLLSQRTTLAFRTWVCDSFSTAASQISLDHMHQVMANTRYTVAPFTLRDVSVRPAIETDMLAG